MYSLVDLRVEFRALNSNRWPHLPAWSSRCLGIRPRRSSSAMGRAARAGAKWGCPPHPRVFSDPSRCRCCRATWSPPRWPSRSATPSLARRHTPLAPRQRSIRGILKSLTKRPAYRLSDPLSRQAGEYIQAVVFGGLDGSARPSHDACFLAECQQLRPRSR